MQDKKDESELIARSLHDDHDAYGQLVDRYKNAVFHHCFAIVRDADAAEDVAQEAFISAYYKLHQYKPEYRLSTWLFKIATNKALDAIKRNKRKVEMDDEKLARIPTTLKGPDVSAEHSELRQKVEALSPRHRAVVSLYYWQGLSYAEIAIALAAPVGSVRGWLHRAKQELKKELS